MDTSKARMALLAALIITAVAHARGDNVVDHSPASEAPAAAQSPSSPYTSEEQRIARLGVRRDILSALAEACGSKFPEHAQQYRAAVQAWSGVNKATLDQADLLMVTRTSRADAKAMEPLIDAERKVLKAWQVNTMGISMQKAPAIGDCDKLAAGFASLP